MDIKQQTELETAAVHFTKGELLLHKPPLPSRDLAWAGENRHIAPSRGCEVNALTTATCVYMSTPSPLPPRSHRNAYVSTSAVRIQVLSADRPNS